MSRRNAFTLIELLVVVAILGTLMAILLPSLRSAKTQTRRTVCATNLRQLGVALQGYTGDHKDRFPFVSMLPSFGPAPLETDEPIYIADVLAPYLNNNAKAFECPADQPGRMGREPPNTDLSYFQSERSSYVYRTRRPPIAGRSIDEVSNQIERFTGQPFPVNTIWVMRDYHNFHKNRPRGSSEDEDEDRSTAGQRNYLYVDGHVTDFEKI